MNVLVIGSVYARNPSDTEVPWLRASLSRLKAQGCKIRVLAPAYKGLSDHEIDGVPVYRFRYATAGLEILTHDEGAPSKMASRPWMQLLAIPYILSGFWRCLRLAWKERPDLIHAHWPFPHGLIALGACKLLGIPLVLNFHGAELLLVRKHPWVRPVLHFIIGQAALVLANSSFTASRIQAIRACSVELSPYGTTLSQAVTRSPRDPALPFRALFVGRHIERKGIDVLLRAASLLPSTNFQFRIVGHGDQTVVLKALAESLSLTNVVFTGKCSSQELEKEYALADAFVLPAIVDAKGDTEGLGVVLIEAAEYGLPLLASNVGGIPDVVVDGNSGLLVPPKDPQALADALGRLSKEPGLSERLVAGARERIAQQFSWDGIIERQLAAYRRLSES